MEENKPDGWKRDRKAKESIMGKDGESVAKLRDAYEWAKRDLREAMKRHSPGATALESYREKVQRTKKEYDARRREGGAGELTRLTTEEDRAWVKYFTYYVDEGYAEEEADEKAWKDLQGEFPRLKQFWGVYPEQKGWMRGRAIAERQTEDTRTCEVCGLVLPMEEMTMLPGGEWVCKRHPEVVKHERELREEERRKEGSLSAYEMEQAIMNAVEHVEKEGYYAFDSEQFAQSVMHTLGPRGHTVRMGPHEGKWVVEIQIGMPLRWPRKMPMTDVARAFEPKGPMKHRLEEHEAEWARIKREQARRRLKEKKRWIAEYELTAGEKGAIAREVIEASTIEEATEIAEMNELLNNYWDLPNIRWKLGPVRTLETTLAYSREFTSKYIEEVAADLSEKLQDEIPPTWEAVKKALKANLEEEWGA